MKILIRWHLTRQLRTYVRYLGTHSHRSPMRQKEDIQRFPVDDESVSICTILCRSTSARRNGPLLTHYIDVAILSPVSPLPISRVSSHFPHEHTLSQSHSDPQRQLLQPSHLQHQGGCSSYTRTVVVAVIRKRLCSQEYLQQAVQYSTSYLPKGTLCISAIQLHEKKNKAVQWQRCRMTF